MYNRCFITHLAIIFAICISIGFQTQSLIAAEQEGIYVLREVVSDTSDRSLSLKMVGNRAPAFTTRELYDPHRLILDIAEMEVDNKLDLKTLLPDNKFSTVQVKKVEGLKPTITRFTFTIKDGYKQDVKRVGNDLEIQFVASNSKAASDENNSQKSAKINSKPEADDARNRADRETEEKIQALIQSTVETTGTDREVASKTEQLQEGFDFTGYNKKKISVDFYKIDLHNVFRLFRQVSDMNLIVDEGVQGSLTLALNDVPWDFALDIILNLADLEKQEKFNTIIVYPKNKEFQWPERAEDNLSFEADLEVVEQESLIIEQSANQPEEIMQAKALIREARLKEKEESYQEAINNYVEAAELWPSNPRLTSKLAVLYLVHLGMNAKAVFYAKESLKVDPDNYNAALYAAIGMANMNKIGEAVEYFDLSISGDPPKKEALASFAAFSEKNGRLSTALKLYDKYNEHYGASVDTMVAKARIYDRLNMKKKALEQYKTVLSSGFRINYGLKKYIHSRLAEKE